MAFIMYKSKTFRIFEGSMGKDSDSLATSVHQIIFVGCDKQQTQTIRMSKRVIYAENIVTLKSERITRYYRML